MYQSFEEAWGVALEEAEAEEDHEVISEVIEAE